MDDNKQHNANHDSPHDIPIEAEVWGLPEDEPTIVRSAVESRIERRTLFENITSNGTIAAAVMVFAAIAAVIMANSPAYEFIDELNELYLGVRIGGISIGITLEEFVNDFLMFIFFLLVGVELKYEMTVGQLRKPRQAMLPMLAAVGGATIPCIIYFAINWGGAVSGWAIPMATDIAFALGVMSLLGSKVRPETKVFFQTLAIADDILGILAIALFYGQAPNISWCGGIAACMVVLALMNKARIMTVRAYTVVGFALWVCFFNSGIHATLAGVVLAFFLPARTDIRVSNVSEWLASQAGKLDDRYDDEAHILGQHDFTETAHAVERVLHHVTPPLERVGRNIAVPVNFVILPLFAFMNAQVRLVGADFGALMVDPVTLGALIGAVVGKPVGIVGVTWLLTKSGFSKLPNNMDWVQVIAVGLMGGLGFTMSILIASLAFTDPSQVLAAKLAILMASVISAALGCAYLLFMTRMPSADDDEELAAA